MQHTVHTTGVRVAYATLSWSNMQEVSADAAVVTAVRPARTSGPILCLQDPEVGTHPYYRNASIDLLTRDWSLRS